ncbi:MAG: STAS domain-containing protein [Campylobacteraceae bacterium]|nr:STAS domain-containing protein [Campylobacteraceae bacterium]
MFSINYENREHITIVRFKGSLTSENIKLIKNDLISNNKNSKNYIFDFKKLEVIDSAGLSYIINCLKITMKNNTQIKILNLINQPKIVFEITRVDSLFEIYNNEREALNSFKNKEESSESNNTNRK